jgi:hypothetical protein
MKKIYEIKYYFDGYGTVKVKAKNEEEALNNWYDGLIEETVEEYGENYDYQGIEEVK